MCDICINKDGYEISTFEFSHDYHLDCVSH